MGFPSSTQVLLLIFFFFTSFLIDFHQKTNNSGFLVLASTDPELLIQDNNSNGDYETRVSSKKFLQVFVVRYKKEIEQSRISRRDQEIVGEPPARNYHGAGHR